MIGFVGKTIILEDYRMKQHYIDEKLVSVTLCKGDYYLPDLIPSAEEKMKLKNELVTLLKAKLRSKVCIYSSKVMS